MDFRICVLIATGVILGKTSQRLERRLESFDFEITWSMKKAFVSFTTENGTVIAEAWTPMQKPPLGFEAK